MKELNFFRIKNLHQAINTNLTFNQNTLILLGENGSCKTTILKMLYYTLSQQWKKLVKLDFEEIETGIDNEIIKINKEELNNFLNYEEKTNNLNHLIKRIILSSGSSNSLERHTRMKDMSNYLRKNQHLNQKNNFKNIKKIKEILDDINVVYLPTYRRIEQELEAIYEENDDLRKKYLHLKRFDQDQKYQELVKFGMQDVDDAIHSTLLELKEYSRSNLNKLTLEYLNDVVGKDYTTVDAKLIKTIDDETIQKVMNRVDDDILSQNLKLMLLDALKDIRDRDRLEDYEKVVGHYFLKLFNVFNKIELNEEKIKKFAFVCNKYLENKYMHYDNLNYDFKINLKQKNQSIDLAKLSSGEKQIVSIFSFLYLSNKKNYIVLIDEPELSLSVKWQKLFLEDIKNSLSCMGLIAVTHSPFIFDNSLDKFAHGIGEFVQ